MKVKDFLSGLCFSILLIATSSAQQIRIVGSDTLIFLGQRFVDQYQHTHSAQFAVLGDEAAAKMDSADIVQSQKPVSAAGSALFPVAVETIVVYVNQSNPVKELSIPQLRKLYLGEITNWKELGGPDADIHLYAGESTTGTLAEFQETVLHGEEPYPFVGKNNTKSLLEVVASDRSAIGYGSVGENEGTRALAIKTGLTSLAMSPTIPNIRSRQYPLTRHIFWSVRSSTRPEVRDFCAWVLSSEGQLVAEGAGFQPVLPEERNAGLLRLGIKPPAAVASGH